MQSLDQAGPRDIIVEMRTPQFGKLKRERRAFTDYRCKDGVASIVLSTGEIWEIQTDTTGKGLQESVAPREFHVRPPDLIRLGKYDPKGTHKCLKVQLFHLSKPFSNNHNEYSFDLPPEFFFLGPQKIPMKLVGTRCVMNIISPSAERPLLTKRTIPPESRRALRMGGKSRAIVKDPSMRNDIIAWWKEFRCSGYYRTDALAYVKAIAHFKKDIPKITVNAVRDIVKGRIRA